MPVRKRGRSLTPASVAEARKKKKKTKFQTYSRMVLTEIRDFILLVTAVVTVFIVASVLQIYFYNGMM